MTDLAQITSPTSSPASSPTSGPIPTAAGAWRRACPVDRLTPDRGVAALVDGRQLALFLLSATGEVAVIDNRDPFSGAQVLSRGLVGDAGGTPKVASPVYKQAFDLRTGRCLDDPAVAIAHHATRVVDGWVEVGVTYLGSA